jgi:peptidyl-prolyl cis-trans isomerase SurA
MAVIARLRDKQMIKLAFSIAVLFACIFTTNNVSHSQNTLNIAAVVNDDVISIYDLSQRVELVIAFSNLQRNQQTQQRIAPDVLRRLILEKLHFQEAERLELEIPEENIQREVARMEKRANMPNGGMERFLSSRGIDPLTLKDQIRAEAAWVTVVQTLFRGLISVSDQEIDDIIEQMRAESGQPEYRVSEIFLVYDDKSRSEVESVALQIHSQLGAGASWPELARNFSQSISAQRGGDLGWNMENELGSILGPVVKQLSPGQISSPVATDDGVYIVLLQEQRTAEGLSAEPPTVQVVLQQLHLAVPEGAGAATIAATTDQARQLSQGISQCTEFESISKASGSPKSGLLGTFELSQLSPQIQEMVAPLQANQVSQPMRTADGVIVLMVCSRETEQGSDPVEQARNEIRSRLLNERLGRLAKQHEDKLRREAFIEIRL